MRHEQAKCLDQGIRRLVLLSGVPRQMSAPLILGCLWVLASAIVAMLPMRRQMLPGVALLIAAPVLLVWIAWVHGWIWLAIGIFAFISMFRNPLRYFLRRALGLPAPLPKELEK